MHRPCHVSLYRKLALGLIGGLAASASHAMVFTDFNATFDCTQMVASPHTFEADRNNTGSPGAGREAYRVEIRDGAGVLLYEFINSIGWPVGGPLSLPPTTFVYVTPPTSNPITFSIVSNAGNGFDEQLAVSATGSCPTVQPPAVSVPALDLWSLGVLAGVMAWLGAWRARRQRHG